MFYKLYFILLILIYKYTLSYYLLQRYTNHNLRNKNLPKKYFSNKITKKLLINNYTYDIYNGEKVYYLHKISIEHIYPKSMLKNEARKDMHNLYLTSKYYNNHRSNYKYVNEKYFNTLNSHILCLDNNCDNLKSNTFGIYIPYNYSRGKISRAIAYMNLIYPNMCYVKTINEFLLNIEILKEWNNNYPPDYEEIERNNIIKNYQGNCNPFISNYKLINYLL